jgi:MIP family channel proteins
MYNLSQKLVAEFIGTFALIFFGAGAICVDFHLRSTGGLGLLAIALAHGLAIAIMVSALGHVSGGHFNPAITIGFWVTRRLSTLDSLAYWGAQLLGAAAAAFLLKLLMPEDVALNTFLGTPELMRDFPRWSGMALEAVTTFFLVLVVFATAVDEHGAFRAIAGFGIGLTITLGILVAGPFTGAALNPARAFGPALASGHWLNWGIYWVGPLGGGFIAGLFYDSLFLRKSDVPV